MTSGLISIRANCFALFSGHSGCLFSISHSQVSLRKYGQLCTNPSLLLESVKWAFPLLWWVRNSKITVVRLRKYSVCQEKSSGHPRISESRSDVWRGEADWDSCLWFCCRACLRPILIPSRPWTEDDVSRLVYWTGEHRVPCALTEQQARSQNGAPVLHPSLMLSTTAVPWVKKVLSYLYVGMIFMFCCETASIKVSGAICLPEQEFPQIFNLNFLPRAFGSRIWERVHCSSWGRRFLSLTVKILPRERKVLSQNWGTWLF